MKYNAMVFPRAFSVTVEADSEDEAMDMIEDYVRKNCTVTLTRYDDSYEPEDLLDDGIDICDLIVVEK